MKIKIRINRRFATAVVASAFLALGCSSSSQQEEDIVYSDQPQEQQEQEYVEASEGTGGEELDQSQQESTSLSGNESDAESENQDSESEDLVADYEEELASEDNPVPSGIANSGAASEPTKQTDWNSSTNDYSQTEGYATNSGSEQDAAPAKDPSLDYTTTASSSYDSGAYDATASTGSSSWGNSTSSKTQWTNSQSSMAGQGYNDNLTTDLQANQRLYIVQKGDTLSSIAHKIYGDAQKWTDLAATNSIANANTIFPGDPIRFTTTENSKDYELTYDNIAKNTVTVQQGDTLSSIAQQVLGDGGAWKFLYTMNKSEITNPNVISPDQVLYYFTRASYNQAFLESNIKERFGH